MTLENKTEIFIDLLADALEAHRLIKRAGLAVRSRAGEELFRQLFLFDPDNATHLGDRLERVQSQSPPNLRNMRFG